MGICFNLTRKGEKSPTPLAKIDEELCRLLDKPVDPIKYVEEWFNIIGFPLATGKTIAEIRPTFDGTFHNDANLVKICDYLEANFTPDSWRDR